jgi:hypothetical protein
LLCLPDIDTGVRKRLSYFKDSNMVANLQFLMIQCRL